MCCLIHLLLLSVLLFSFVDGHITSGCQFTKDQCAYNINLRTCEQSAESSATGSFERAVLLMGNMTSTLQTMQNKLGEYTPQQDGQLQEVSASLRKLQSEMESVKSKVESVQNENMDLKAKMEQILGQKKAPLGSSPSNAGRSCLSIFTSRPDAESGVYWVLPPGEHFHPAETFCDMAYNGGGWSLASYGYIGRVGVQPENRNIPNMNGLHGYNWAPKERMSSHGVINLVHGAVLLARNASDMIMAAGGNPSTGGIDRYTYIYKINIRNQEHPITFANHNAAYGASTGMHLQKYPVVALKGDTGTVDRYGLAESLGVTWPDTYPTGYGFNERQHAYQGAFSKGPFFPSVHTGDRQSGNRHGIHMGFAPDVQFGSVTYNHKGWYSLHGTGHTGQMSIWFR